jgi:hypothetical protein
LLLEELYHQSAIDSGHGDVNSDAVNNDDSQREEDPLTELFRKCELILGCHV